MRRLACVLAVGGLVFVFQACSTSSPSASNGDSGPPLPSTCADGTLSGDETDIDCGGTCNKCALAKSCKKDGDCVDQVCTGGKCAAGTSEDGKKNGDETDIDCGGKRAGKCSWGKGCAANDDCASKQCANGTCQASISDGSKNGDETDVDCGGSQATKCSEGRRCLQVSDCISGACVGKICQPAAYNDGFKNLDETDVDCGGPSKDSPRCDVGKVCDKPNDCLLRACNASTKKCIQPAINGIQDGSETDIDCGGGAAPPCATNKGCFVESDCDSLVCTTGKCVAATGTDGKQNGDESDVDCGGTTTGAPKCVLGKACSVHSDCASDGCDYKKKCIAARSCTQHFGGDTCGVGEIGETGFSHESCCTTIAIQRPGGAAVKLDKYAVTAGRMQEFIKRTGGNVKGFITGNPKYAPWASFVNLLPTNTGEALAQLGPVAQDWEWPPAGDPTYPRNPWAARGCQIAGGGDRSFYQDLPAPENTRYPKDVLDQKSLNCVTKIMLAAFCIWDGGELPSGLDMSWAWRGPGNNKWPWGATPDAPTSSWPRGQYLAQIVNKWNYQYPTWISPDGSAFNAAPGRRPAGNGPFGHSDLAGLTYQLTKDGLWFNSGSWEVHEAGAGGGYGTNDPTVMATRRYHAIGGRCAR